MNILCAFQKFEPYSDNFIKQNNVYSRESHNPATKEQPFQVSPHSLDCMFVSPNPRVGEDRRFKVSADPEYPAILDP